MFKIKPKLKIHNEFDVAVRESTTGEIVKRAKAYNIALDAQVRAYVRAVEESDDNSYTSGVCRMYVGRGSGVPSAIDTALFSEIASYEVVELGDTVSFALSTTEVKITIGETSLVGETITELGLGLSKRSSTTSASYCTMISHAMLEDSEGNPISIGPKTDTQIIEITAKLYVEMTTTLGCDFVWHKRNIYNAMFLPKSYAHNLLEGLVEFYPGLSRKLCSLSRVDDVYSMVASRLLSTEGNVETNSIQAINIESLGFIRFPNTTYFPAMTFTDDVIGAGDAATKCFDFVSGFYVPGTVTVKVDGVLQTEGVDYKLQQGNQKTNLFCNALKRYVPIGLESSDNVDYSECPPSHYDDLKITLDSLTGDELLLPDCPVDGDDLYDWSKNADREIIDLLTHPIYVDFGRETQLKEIYMYNSRYNLHLTLEGSTDGINWTTILADAYLYDDMWNTESLADVSVRYLRLSTVATNSDYASLEIFNIFPAGNVIFTNAPASGAVITATYNTDVPPKTSDYSYDIAYEVDFS